MSPTTTSGELRVDGLYIERGGSTVVHNASLTVPTGQVTALLGPNGAGRARSPRCWDPTAPASRAWCSA